MADKKISYADRLVSYMATLTPERLLFIREGTGYLDTKERFDLAIRHNTMVKVVLDAIRNNDLDTWQYEFKMLCAHVDKVDKFGRDSEVISEFSDDETNDQLDKKSRLNNYVANIPVVNANVNISSPVSTPAIVAPVTPANVVLDTKPTTNSNSTNKPGPYQVLCECSLIVSRSTVEDHKKKILHSALSKSGFKIPRFNDTVMKCKFCDEQMETWQYGTHWKKHRNASQAVVSNDVIVE